MNLEDYLIYRDAMILALNKPAGIAVHAGSKSTNAIDKFFFQLQFGLPNIPQLAHRLDKDTSGCLVLGRHSNALRLLGKLFENNKVQKTYLAVVEGHPPKEQGVIDLPISPQSDKKYHWWVKIDPNGKPALTEYLVLEKIGNFALLQLTPKTGRTHQLRIHCSAIGCPILGDKIYGNDQYQNEGLFLHASTITIPLYPKKDPILITAPLPSKFQNFLQK